MNGFNIQCTVYITFTLYTLMSDLGLSWFELLSSYFCTALCSVSCICSSGTMVLALLSGVTRVGYCFN